MTQTFSDLKKQLIDYHQRVQSADQLSVAFNRLTDQQELREITDGLKKNFPKGNSTLGDEYTMHYAYAMMDPAQRSEQDKADWRKHAKNFINRCEAPHNLSDHLRGVLVRLPEMGGSSAEAFNYGLRILNLLPKDYGRYQECVTAVQKMAQTDFYTLLSKAKAEPDYHKQLRAFDRALARLTDIPVGERYRKLDECIRAMAPVYNQNEWGRLELPRKRRLASNRIFKSLPYNVQNIIRTRKNLNDWWSR